MLKRILVLSAVLMLMCGGAPHAQTSNFAADFSWEGTASCFDPKSPPFSLTGAPTGTETLKFSMKDLDAPNFRRVRAARGCRAPRLRDPPRAGGTPSRRRSAPPSHRDASAGWVLADNAAGVTRRWVRTSAPTAAPSRKRRRDRTPPAGPQRRLKVKRR
jgi:hypothetical protein